QIEWRLGLLTEGERDLSSGTLLNARFTGPRSEFRQFRRSESIRSRGATVGADWIPGPWRLAAEAGVASSVEDRDELRVGARIEGDAAGGYSLAGGARYPSIDVTGASIDPALLPLSVLELEQREIALAESHVRLDARRELERGPIVAVSSGLRLASSRFKR